MLWLPEGGDSVQESYVNLIPTAQGGTHVNGLRQGLLDAMREFCEFRSLLPRGVKLAPEDVWERIAFVLSMKMQEPQFSGQTKDRQLWADMWAYKDHGKSWEAVYEREHAPGFRWLHESFGTNWRMLEVQAVIGRIQLRRMQDWHRSRLNNARAIWEAAGQLPALRIPALPDDQVHAAYKCYVFVRPECLKPDWSRDRILNEIVARGVPAFSGSCSEVYLEKAFDNTGWRPAQRLVNARELGETSMMFMVHPTLTDQEIELTCKVISEVVQLASLA